jgi:c-di-GMP-binding flagellar brake protein YcgR
MSKEIALTIEKFYNDDEEEKFLIHSKKEIQLTLHAIAQKKSRAVLYFDHGKQFIMTVILAVDHEGMWLDVGPSAADNEQILRSDEFVLVSMHHHAKVQLAGSRIYQVNYAGKPSFYMQLPERMLRLQRRDYFRLPIPPSAALKCVIPATPDLSDQSHEVTIMDISVGGVALVCKEQGIRLETGQTYPDCRINLPGIGTLVATVEVRNLFEVSAKNGVVTKHAGCEFVRLSGQMSMLLQRYIAQMQRQLAATR